MSSPVETPLRSEKALKHLRRRRAADTRFRVYGLVALGFALFSLVFLICAIAWKASSAVTYHVVKTDIVLEADRIVPDGNASPSPEISKASTRWCGMTFLRNSQTWKTLPQYGRTSAP